MFKRFLNHYWWLFFSFFANCSLSWFMIYFYCIILYQRRTVSGGAEISQTLTWSWCAGRGAGPRRDPSWASPGSWRRSPPCRCSRSATPSSWAGNTRSWWRRRTTERVNSCGFCGNSATFFQLWRMNTFFLETHHSLSGYGHDANMSA